ncbi:MAG: hypothetical protein K0S55_1730 [Clostridia bacterium]|nr:hypothetical protein [Clostridia bacterium]
MLYPSINELISGKEQCRYSLVIAVAKKARAISKQAEDRGEKLEKKPVKLSIEAFAAGNSFYKEPDKNKVF